MCRRHLQDQSWICCVQRVWRRKILSSDRLYFECVHLQRRNDWTCCGWCHRRRSMQYLPERPILHRCWCCLKHLSGLPCTVHLWHWKRQENRLYLQGRIDWPTRWRVIDFAFSGDALCDHCVLEHILYGSGCNFGKHLHKLSCRHIFQHFSRE